MAASHPATAVSWRCCRASCSAGRGNCSRPPRVVPHEAARHRFDVQPARSGWIVITSTGRRWPPRTSCCRRTAWRRIASGFAKDPGSPIRLNKGAPVTRIYLPPDANTRWRWPTTACAAPIAPTSSSPISRGICSLRRLTKDALCQGARHFSRASTDATRSPTWCWRAGTWSSWRLRLPRSCASGRRIRRDSSTSSICSSCLASEHPHGSTDRA